MSTSDLSSNCLFQSGRTKESSKLYALSSTRASKSTRSRAKLVPTLNLVRSASLCDISRIDVVLYSTVHCFLYSAFTSWLATVQ